MLVEETDRISPRKFRRPRQGWIRLGTIGWQHSFRPSLDWSAGFRVFQDSLESATLTLTLEDGSSQVIQSEATPQRVGRHWWFRCPKCGGRHKWLYSPRGVHRFLCKDCYGLRYW